MLQLVSEHGPRTIFGVGAILFDICLIDV
jgi:hypothetical protein